MNNTMTINHTKFGPIRAIFENGEFLLCGKDVATALGFSDYRKALGRYVCEGRLRTLKTAAGLRLMTVISKDDAQRLAENSKRMDAAQVISCIEDTVNSLQKETIPKTKTAPVNTNLQSKVRYYDSFVSTGVCATFTVVSKELGVPRGRFIKFLINSGFLYRNNRGELLPYYDAMRKGLFVVKDFCRNGYFGAYTLVTPKGKDVFQLMIASSEDDSEDTAKRYIYG